jgi:hypothetical protein
MKRKQAVFEYSDEQLAALEKALSTDRLQPYLILSNGEKLQAIQLYEWIRHSPNRSTDFFRGWRLPSATPCIAP